MKYLRSIGAACLVVIASTAWAVPPVPLYALNVTKIDKVSPGDIVIVTKDSPEAVLAWYRKNLVDLSSEIKADDGAVIFYTKSGATVDVEKGNRFDPGTHIGTSWDAKKFGPYQGK